MKYLTKIYNYFTQPPTALTMAALELQDAERSFIEALTALEYSESQVEYNRKRIARLREYVGTNIQYNCILTGN